MKNKAIEELNTLKLCIQYFEGTYLELKKSKSQNIDNIEAFGEAVEDSITCFKEIFKLMKIKFDLKDEDIKEKGEEY